MNINPLYASLLNPPSYSNIYTEMPRCNSFETADRAANFFLSRFGLPSYRYLEFYDETGLLHFKEGLSERINLRGIHPSMRNKMIIRWCSPLELGFIFNSIPDIEEKIISMQKFKPMPPSDYFKSLLGAIHRIEIIFEPGVEPFIRAAYTSGVHSSDWVPPMEADDEFCYMSDGSWDLVFTNVSFPLSDFVKDAKNYPLPL